MPAPEFLFSLTIDGYSISANTGISLQSIWSLLFNIFMIVLMTGIVALIVALLFKEIITGILRRGESIELMCADTSEEALHIITRHQHSGGDAEENFSSFPHYLIRLTDGNMYISRKISGQRNDTRSLELVSTKLRLALAYRLADSLHLPWYDSQNQKHTEGELHIADYTIHARKYRNWFDYGFRITCRKDGKFCWKRLL